jgi:hypothetical protein
MKTLSRTSMALRSLILATIVTALPTHLAAAASLQNTPFWRDSAGWWTSNNTYLNSERLQSIAAYNSIVHIEIRGEQVVETSYRFYPPGKQTGYYSNGQVSNDHGIELVSVTIMDGH